MQIIFAILIVVVIFIPLKIFYRHPSDPVQNYDEYNLLNLVTAPSFGTLTNIRIDEVNKEYHICTVLQVYDIHRQYYPTFGYFLDSTRDDIGTYSIATNCGGKTRMNEKVITRVAMESGRTIKIVQIAGLLARRIDAYGKQPRARVSIGEDLGIIHFGSRVDIHIPMEDFTLVAKVGQKMKGSNTILGYYN